jgi:hypothetical protein
MAVRPQLLAGPLALDLPLEVAQAPVDALQSGGEGQATGVSAAPLPQSDARPDPWGPHQGEQQDRLGEKQRPSPPIESNPVDQRMTFEVMALLCVSQLSSVGAQVHAKGNMWTGPDEE